jgi:hypothetical protein
MIPWSVILLFGIVTVVTIAMGLYLAALNILISIARAKSSPDYTKAVENYTPNALFSWIRQAIYETGAATYRSVTGLVYQLH